MSIADAQAAAQAQQMMDLLERPADNMAPDQLITVRAAASPPARWLKKLALSVCSCSPTLLPQLDPEILQAFLCGSSWAESFDAFFLAHCELFVDFSVGTEHTLQQTDIHIKFVKTAEGLLDGQ